MKPRKRNNSFREVDLLVTFDESVPRTDFEKSLFKHSVWFASLDGVILRYSLTVESKSFADAVNEIKALPGVRSVFLEEARVRRPKKEKEKTVSNKETKTIDKGKLHR